MVNVEYSLDAEEFEDEGGSLWGDWVFMGRMVIFVRVDIVDIGLDWDELGLKYGSLGEIFF